MHTTITRRGLLKRSAATAAALGLSGLTARAYGEVVGSNEDIHIATIGLNGRGQSHLDAWKHIKGVRLVGVCDCDEAVLERVYDRNFGKLAERPTTQPSIANSSSQEEVPQPPRAKQFRPDKYIDARQILDNKHVDAISIATPNHWHALLTVWGCQAGKDVYCEKPVSHNVWEGRKSVEASRKYNRIVQTGTQSRSNQGFREAFEWVRAGNLGKIILARGLCYKRRGSIGKTEGPQPIPSTVVYDLWTGPAAKLPLRRKNLHYDWHWVWNTGCGDIGNQGIHEMDKCRWALGKNELAPKVMSVGGRFGYKDDGETPNTQFAIHDYGDVLLIFEVRGLPEHPGSPRMDKYKGETIGQVIECEGGYLSGKTAFDKDGNEVKKFGGDVVERDHFANFIEAVKSRRREDLTADILEGHLSSALCHTSNISYRLGHEATPGQIQEAIRSDKAAMETFERFQEHLKANDVDITLDKATLGPLLTLDPKTERFVNNARANELVSRRYRPPFVVPDQV